MTSSSSSATPVATAAAVAPPLSLLLVVLLLLLAQPPLADSSSFDEPHGHDGVVSPFEPGDPRVPLDAAALKVLGAGKPYQTQIQSGMGGRGLVVQDVSAPTDVVWSKILDYDNYATMVPKTVESKNYLVIDHPKPTKKNPLAQTIYTRMKVGFPMIKLEFFVKHLYYPSLNSLTWTLDYTKKSDFNDSCGYWYVVPHPDDPNGRTRVYYSVEVSMFDWVPKFVVDFMSSKALTDATGWVKKYSELDWEGKRPRGDAGKADERVGAGENGGTETKTRRRNPIGNFFERRKDAKRKRLEERAARQEEAEQCEEAPTATVDVEAADQRSLGSTAAEEEEVGWVRCGLVLSVFVLVMYNIHLCLSQ